MPGIQNRGRADGLQWDLRFLHAGEWNLHTSKADLARGRSGAGVVIAGDGESHQCSHVARHFKIRIAVVDPSMNALCSAVGKRNVGVDDDAVVVEVDGDGDGFGL